MSLSAYAEVLDDSGANARAREREAMEHLIVLLKAAKSAGARSREAVDALTFLRRLWAFLMEDLGSPSNALPKKLRADLISIGLWMMREADDIRLLKSEDFTNLIAISEILRDGLR